MPKKPRRHVSELITPRPSKNRSPAGERRCGVQKKGSDLGGSEEEPRAFVVARRSRRWYTFRAVDPGRATGASSRE
jgi:hypothetical protein